MAFTVTLQPSGHSFEGYADETVLASALEAGIHLAYGCRNGACGACKGKVVAGSFDHGNAQEHALSPEERAAGFALMCCATPYSDLVVECREAVAESDICVRNLPVRVEKLDRVAPDVMRMRLKLPANERLQFLAGQTIDFRLKDGRRRAFSIANAPQDDAFIEVHVRLVPGGEFTEYVFGRLKERDILRIEGPHGSFQLQELSQKPVILLAGGTGFAPVKSIVEYTLHNRIARPLTIYWGARDRSGLYLPDLPRQWAAQHAHIRYVPVLSEARAEDGWDGRSGLAHRAVLEDHADLSAYQVYACGAPAMIEAARRDFCARGLPADEFYADAFTYAPKEAPSGGAPQEIPRSAGSGLGPALAQPR
ncbi:MAG: CDP-6-deoxy-delta-3,4-glucoseen reductase [Rhodocyclales bacterium GWA2_65_20]|nr:MAG: CDP-6-deoxy-delta-3,4-glucoseen reductase [Rhodocyclales bacterium GWA2_65_20]